MFAHVRELRGILLNVGIVELILVVFYFVWNLWLTGKVAASESVSHKPEAERAMNEARGEFISNMSHDIRTPLNGIVGMLQIIKEHRHDEKMVDECLEKIEISTQYLSTLASDMLDINEIENDKLVIEQEPINLLEIVKDMD